MSGFTIMAKFKNIPDLEGLSISEAKNKIEADQFKMSLAAALNKAFDQIIGIKNKGGLAIKSNAKFAQA